MHDGANGFYDQTYIVSTSSLVSQVLVRLMIDRGYVCAATTPERLATLQIPMMVENNTEKHRTAYTVTVDFKEGVSTGISAHDRALTARKLADPQSTPSMFNRPGHLVPLRANSRGVLGRRGHTEATTGLSIPLCRLGFLIGSMQTSAR
jgi:3,4-dihydroxy-2-butanone 4-phosphate synthase